MLCLNQEVSLKASLSATELFAELSRQTGVRFTFPEAFGERSHLVCLVKKPLRIVLDTLCELNNWQWRQVDEKEIKLSRPLPLARSDLRSLPQELSQLLPGDGIRFLEEIPQGFRFEKEVLLKALFLELQKDFLKSGPMAFSTLAPNPKKRLLESLVLPALLGTRGCLRGDFRSYHDALTTRIAVSEFLGHKSMSVTGRDSQGEVTITTAIRLPGRTVQLGS